MTTTELAGERTDLAMERTVMAVSRTLMAWIRTSLSLIGFGFTIYKVLQATAHGAELGLSVHSPRRIGLTLITLGTASMAFGLFEYIDSMSRLNRRSRIKHRVLNFYSVLGVVLILFGAFLFISILAHIEVF